MNDNSTLIEAAEAVKDALNNAPYGTFGDHTFTAIRVYRPAFTPAQLADLRVVVLPRAENRSNLARGKWAFAPEVQVGVMQQLTRPADGSDPMLNNDQADGLMALVATIGDYLGDAAVLRGYRQVGPQLIENDPAWSVEHMADTGTFISVLTLTLGKAKNKR
jgi:hypothetical protein